MQFDILYKVKITYHGGYLCGESNLFPMLDIRYREKGSRKWIRLGSAEIDLYTYRRFKNTYYKDFEKRMTTIMTLESKFDYERLTLFTDILETEFDGDMNSFVNSIVREEIAMADAETEERRDVDRITISLVTNGWKEINLEI